MHIRARKRKVRNTLAITPVKEECVKNDRIGNEKEMQRKEKNEQKEKKKKKTSLGTNPL